MTVLFFRIEIEKKFFCGCKVEKMGLLWSHVERKGDWIMFFIGTYNHSLDEKNRVILPSKLRDKLCDKDNPTIYVTLGLDKCIAIYPAETYEAIASRLSKASSLEGDNRGYKRTFFSNSYDITVDRQGRVPLSKELCAKCSVKRDVVIIGVDDHVEIWDRDLYAAMSEQNDENYESYASRIHIED